MRIVVALGGNALLRRGEALSAPNQFANIQRAAAQLALVADGNELVLTHGNGPQVGLLALQSAAYAAVEAYPLDVLGAQTDGMIGYLLEQELNNLLPLRVVVTLMTRVLVHLDDPAFAAPSKPIGPVYTGAEAKRIAQEEGWTMAADGKGFRRVVPSPTPQSVFGLQPMEWLLAHEALVIAAGGGGIPVAVGADGHSLHGVEAVIDKDSCSALLARDLNAECLVIATDVSAVYMDFGLPTQRPVHSASPDAFRNVSFAAGSMGPKVAAACAFVKATGQRAVIGSLDQIEAMLRGEAGTQVRADGALTP
ncbi:carbamate kinase [Nitratidesulfovibrio sp.]|uniref:carbamate kinase n=1 Tax=Nitratidesulfovibrio sp. TaxID=2802297 RepID=UPI003340D2D9